MGRWSKQGCINSSREYDYLKTWIQEKKTAYLAARDNGWLEECCAHMSERKNKKWSLDKCTEHMPDSKELTKVWTKEKCKEIASQYKYLKQWQVSNPSSYQAAKRNKWLDVCCEHMDILVERLTLDKCKKSALNHTALMDWRNADAAAYNAAQSNGWLSECCSHMAERRHSVSKAECTSAAEPYSSIDDFFKHEHFFYKIAKENRWLPEIKNIFYERNARAWIEKNLRGADG